MSTTKETIEFVLAKLGQPKRFATRAMFGEYALYADAKVVALICDDQLYVKIHPATAELESICEKGEPYPGAKLHYLIDEGQLGTLEQLPQLLFDLSEALPAKKPKPKKK